MSGIAEHPTNARQLLSSSLDGSLRVWDADDAACLDVVDLGVPITHLSAPRLHDDPGSSASSGNAFAYIAVSVGGEPGSEYPLGNEVACLRPRPLATSFAFAVNTTGRSRPAPRSLVVEVDLALRRPTRRLGGGRGFVAGLESRCQGPAAAATRTVVFALRRRLYVWRSGEFGW